MAKLRQHGEGALIQIYGPKNPKTGEKKLKSRFWYAQYYSVDGRQIRVNTKRTVRQEALRELRRLMAARDAGALDPNTVRKTTYADLRAGLLANYIERGNRSLTTRADGSETVVGLAQLDEFFGFSREHAGPSVVAINTDTARNFVKQRKAEGVGNAVINRSLACLRRMLKIAQEDKRIQDVPVIRLLKEPPARRNFVTNEQFSRLAESLPLDLRPLVAFLYFCGVRIGEALAVTWEQVDWKAGVIRLHETKNDEPRMVPLPSVLRKLLASREPKAGKVFDATNLRKEWMRACAASGLGRMITVAGREYDPRYEGLTIHDLRRSAVRNLVQAGNAESLVMRISGHRTRSVFDRYAIASEGDLTTAMEKVVSNGFGETLVKLLPVKPRKSLMALSSRG